MIGSSNQSHFAVGAKGKVSGQHIRIFRRKTSLWLEVVVKDQDNTLINRRKILGPVELLDGDTIELPGVSLKFSLKDAC